MFGALNRFISRLDGEPEDQQSIQDAGGFQVLRNTNKDLSLEPWFDFIIGINGRTLDNNDPNLFATEVRNCAGSTLSLGVWSSKGQKIREIYAPVPKESPALGLSLQWMPLISTGDVWHVLDVSSKSPADLAGILPYGDYIVGSPEGVVKGESGLAELVEDYLDRPLQLFVYNHEYDVTRLVDITPSRQWGGQGALGCTLGYGALHRIPPPLDEPPDAPGDTIFDTSTTDEKQGAATASAALSDPAEFVVLAEQFSQPSMPSRGASPKEDRKLRHHAHIAPSAEMDEYFREGEQRSKEEDNAPTPKPKAGLPPPPKAGGKLGHSKDPAS